VLALAEEASSPVRRIASTVFMVYNLLVSEEEPTSTDSFPTEIFSPFI